MFWEMKNAKIQKNIKKWEYAKNSFKCYNQSSLIGKCKKTGKLQNRQIKCKCM